MGFSWSSERVENDQNIQCFGPNVFDRLPLEEGLPCKGHYSVDKKAELLIIHSKEIHLNYFQDVLQSISSEKNRFHGFPYLWWSQKMIFTWDEAKRKINLAKHGFDFANAERVFSGQTFTFEDDRFDYSEQRFITMGALEGKVVVIAHTEQYNIFRIISMRKGTKREQKLYFRGFRN